MFRAEMATTAMAATIMPAFAPVLRVFELVTSVVGCGEVEGKVEGKDDEDPVVAFMDLGAMYGFGCDVTRLVAMERLEVDGMRVFAIVAAVVRLDVEELPVLDVNALDAAGAPRLLAINAPAVEVVGLGSGREDQTTGG